MFITKPYVCHRKPLVLSLILMPSAMLPDICLALYVVSSAVN